MDPVSLNDYNHVQSAIRQAVFSALEDTGLDAIAAHALIECMHNVDRQRDPGTSLIGYGLRDYLNKLIVCGGPKPRNIDI